MSTATAGTPATTINLEPLRQVFRAINADPSIHNQSFWGVADANPAEQPACKTAFCIAGHLAIGDGWEPDWEEDRIFDHKLMKYVTRYTFADVTKDGETRPTEDVAAELVVPGVEDDYARDQIDFMFEGTNNPAEIQEYAEALANLAGEPLGVVLLPEHPSHKVD